MVGQLLATEMKSNGRLRVNFPDIQQIMGLGYNNLEEKKDDKRQ